MKPKPKPKTKTLPPIRVEPRLYDAIQALADQEQRSVSAVIRTMLRETLRGEGRL